MYDVCWGDLLRRGRCSDQSIEFQISFAAQRRNNKSNYQCLPHQVRVIGRCRHVSRNSLILSLSLSLTLSLSLSLSIFPSLSPSFSLFLPLCPSLPTRWDDWRESAQAIRGSGVQVVTSSAPQVNIYIYTPGEQDQVSYT